MVFKFLSSEHILQLRYTVLIVFYTFIFTLQEIFDTITQVHDSHFLLKI